MSNRRTFSLGRVIDYTPSDGQTDSPRVSSTEGGYIVFTFNDHGAYHIMKDQKSERSRYFERVRAQITRKLNYEDVLTNFNVDEVESLNCSNKDGVAFKASTQGESDVYNEKGEDEESIYFEACTSDPPISHESSASDDSTGSFAFPVLSRVWSGSPIKMPRTKVKHSKKHKDWRVVLLCCKF
ncbi:hypothetical protein FRX31_025615 [Thalictrum thalictroides]|uniref:Uncharacterized protein n=1 Tax=Thalictrum thalictroides TaxID=46969 RepID=A0A7J6VKD9_THATH|nr:hypothetical protein FRX31_025615 [Thalictrum thalictroides]